MKILTIIFLSFFLILFANNLTAQKAAPSWQWATRAGGSAYDEVNAMETDDAGNSYIYGNFTGTAYFGGITLNASGGRDAFVAKITSNGQWQWVVQVPMNVYQGYGRKLSIDAAGNIYFTGLFKGTENFGGTTLSAIGLEDLYVAKLNNNGQWQWAVNAGVINSYMDGAPLKVDEAGNCFITGSLKYGDNIFGNIKITGTQAGGGYVAKLDNNGKWQWVEVVEGTIGFSGITTDAIGDVILTGGFKGSLNLNNISLTSTTHSTIVAKINKSGVWQWATKAVGSKSSNYGFNGGYGITSSLSGDIYITGGFADTLDFGVDTLIQSAKPFPNTTNVYAAKLNNNGQWQWAVKAGGDGESHYGYDIKTDKKNNIFLAGSFYNAITTEDTIFFSPSLSSFLAKLDKNGKWLWTIGVFNSVGIRLDTIGNIYTSGRFGDPITFGSYQLTSAGEADIYVAKLKDANETTSINEDNGHTGNRIEIFPNPATTILNIRTLFPLKEPTVITDITGRQVMGIINIGQKHNTIDLSMLNKGLYFITIDKKIYKFIKE